MAVSFKPSSNVTLDRRKETSWRLKRPRWKLGPEKEGAGWKQQRRRRRSERPAKVPMMLGKEDCTKEASIARDRRSLRIMRKKHEKSRSRRTIKVVASRDILFHMQQGMPPKIERFIFRRVHTGASAPGIRSERDDSAMDVDSEDHGTTTIAPHQIGTQGNDHPSSARIIERRKRRMKLGVPESGRLLRASTLAQRKKPAKQISVRKPVF
ncbi:hypothetical protein GYMLUDRAFT_253221 [Collybiopsis luxurians FD-317 M1]|uniref:Uncharacterized protein n=1 Tax=Collybiopsis luxurians FD-317 M1 TaxID=944289 RepID=A0A0D0BL38_9AGAR|nr:hypothetical protein GYMLUDRAFT_253221 [Collybiopsis luxurians FD-317 M1]